jgi:hypothetical protein
MTAGRAAGAVATAAVAAITCALAGCATTRDAGDGGPPGSSPHIAATPSASPGPGRGMTWLVTRAALAELAADPVVRAALAQSRVYEIVPGGERPVPGMRATLVASFESAAKLDTAVTGGQLPAGTGGVLYDPEHWPFTPAAEQHDPQGAAATAAAIAHAHGLQFIVTPALDLGSVIAPRSSAPRWQLFLDLRLAARIAPTANVIDLQAQSLEASAASYAAFVRQAAAQARSANPAVTVLAGLSTNLPGAVVDSQELTAAIRASAATVNGYWLNIPEPGPYCPTCTPARPQVGIAALRAVL